MLWKKQDPAIRHFKSSTWKGIKMVRPRRSEFLSAKHPYSISDYFSPLFTPRTNGDVLRRIAISVRKEIYEWVSQLEKNLIA